MTVWPETLSASSSQLFSCRPTFPSENKTVCWCKDIQQNDTKHNGSRHKKKSFCFFMCHFAIDIESLRNWLLKVCYVTPTRAHLPRLLFLLRPLTVLIKQTRQAVCTIKQSILLRCLCILWNGFLVKWVPGRGLERRESGKTVLHLQIISILISYIITIIINFLNYYLKKKENHPSKNW